MKKTLVFLFCISFFLVSCSSKKYKSQPTSVLKDKQSLIDQWYGEKFFQEMSPPCNKSPKEKSSSTDAASIIEISKYDQETPKAELDPEELKAHAHEENVLITPSKLLDNNESEDTASNINAAENLFLNHLFPDLVSHDSNQTSETKSESSITQ